MIKLIIFDFDGVLVESVQVKTSAFKQLFSEYPDALFEIITYHENNGGISRFEKISYIYREILKQDLSVAMHESLCQRFSALVLQGVISAPPVPGAEEFLHFCQQRVPLVILSGTPEDELQTIVSARGWNEFFEDVYGSPTTKIEHLTTICIKHEVQPQEALYVGDARTDYEAARAVGVQFIGRINSDIPEQFSEYKDQIMLISDLLNLMNNIEEKLT